MFRFAYRQNSLFLDNASIKLSGCLKRSRANEVKLKAKSKRYLKIIRFVVRQNEIIAHCSLLIAQPLHCTMYSTKIAL
ncbi:MAG: hypothetical protein IJV35_02625 [Neisseriaceae bacterium]|nr:hypothetical protein [Neisseriaceae bacterium]